MPQNKECHIVSSSNEGIKSNWICTLCAVRTKDGKSICTDHKNDEDIIMMASSFGNENEWVRKITRFSFNRLYPHADMGRQHRWIDDEVVNGFFQMARDLDFEICSESNRQRSFFGHLTP